MLVPPHDPQFLDTILMILQVVNSEFEIVSK